MKRVATLLLFLFIFLAALCATDVSFLVPAEITNYSYDKSVNKQINDNKTVSLTLSDSDIISFTTSNNKTFDAKLVTTAESNINATFSWNIANQNTKLRYTLNNSKPKTIKSDISEITIKNIPSNELSIFTLEVKVNKKWLECGRVGLIPVNVIEEQTQNQEELIEPVVNDNSSIDTLEPKLINTAKANRKLILSSYFISSLQILSFESSTINNGMGVKSSLALPITSNLSLVLDSNYQWLKYFDKNYNELALMVKLRINSNINDSGIVFIQLGGGENFVSKANNKAYYPLVSTGLGLELYFTKSIALSFLGEYSISFQRDSINNHISGAVGVSIAFSKEAKVWKSLF